ncbi:MAG: hypothetical protein DRN14_06110 [Thermoplasmata archaeon]|nr:MAG: hypothetical protein DRN14_06110 [Thermoplasmata archaeon]
MESETRQNEYMSKVVVVHLKRNSMEVYGVVSGEKVTTAEVEWTEKNLVEKFKLVKEKFETKKVRILLADGVSYLWVRPIKKDEEITRKQLEKEMESEFPDAVGSMWDYAIVDEGEGKVALVFAPVKEIFDQVAEAASKAKLVIEDVEPERFARRRGDDPVVEIAKKKLKGKDEDVLSMKVEIVETVDSVGSVDAVDSVNSAKVKTRDINKILMIVGGVIILIGLIVGGILVSRSATSESEEIVITPIATATPELTPKPTEWSEVSMQILNGSGVTGRAGEIADLMMEFGVEEDKIETGNADNYDYDGVEVAVREGLGEDVYDQIEEAFLDEYDVIEIDGLDKDSKYDVVIVVGQKN